MGFRGRVSSASVQGRLTRSLSFSKNHVDAAPLRCYSRRFLAAYVPPNASGSSQYRSILRLRIHQPLLGSHREKLYLSHPRRVISASDQRTLARSTRGSSFDGAFEPELVRSSPRSRPVPVDEPCILFEILWNCRSGTSAVCPFLYSLSPCTPIRTALLSFYPRT